MEEGRHTRRDSLCSDPVKTRCHDNEVQAAKCGLPPFVESFEFIIIQFVIIG
jgi:hypothetical protein